MQPKYSGPYRVSQVLPSDTYRIVSLDPKQKFTTTVHVSHLKSYQNPSEKEDKTTSSSSEESEAERRDEECSSSNKFINHTVLQVLPSQ